MSPIHINDNDKQTNIQGVATAKGYDNATGQMAEQYHYNSTSVCATTHDHLMLWSEQGSVHAVQSSSHTRQPHNLLARMHL